MKKAKKPRSQSKKARGQSFLQKTISHEEKVNVIEWCLAERDAYWDKYHGRLPHRVGEEAAERLGVSYRTIKTYLDRAILALDDLSADDRRDQHKVRAVIDKALIQRPPGRKQDPKLTEEQQQVASFAYLNRHWIAVLDGEEPKQVTIAPTTEIVFRLLLYIWPNIAATIVQVRKFLKREVLKAKAKYTLAREGKRIFWKHYILRRTNDAAWVNLRWIIDARPLPVYVRYKNTVCTVTLVVIMDDLSRYGIRWFVIPRKIENEAGAVKKVDFTSSQARALFVSALYTTGIRPWIVYSDNGGQFQSWEDIIEYLTEPLDQPILPIFSRKGHPEGRGKVEIIQGLVDSGLLGSFGLITDDSKDGWREKWKEVMKSPAKLDDYKVVQKSVNNYLRKRWNKGILPEFGKTRKELWEEHRASSLPAPSNFRLAIFGAAEIFEPVPVREKGIRYRSRFYHPITDEGYVRIARRMDDQVLLSLVPVSDTECMAFAALEPGQWEPVVPEDTLAVFVGDHVKQQESVPRHIMGEVAADEQKLINILKEKFGGHGLPAFERGTNFIIGIGDQVPLNQGPISIPDEEIIASSKQQSSSEQSLGEAQAGAEHQFNASTGQINDDADERAFQEALRNQWN
jgi:transposase InsO family protein